MHERMDWRTVRFDWNRARAFLVTAEEKSFSAAARALGIAQPTIGRQVAGLEEELEVTLFERIGNQLELTDAGMELLEHARAMGEAASRFSRSAEGSTLGVEGVVSITASEVISAHLLPPAIARVRREYPGLQLDLVASNMARDLQRREADIAVRNFQPKQPELLAKKLGVRSGRLYAAESYLDRVGRPTSPTDLTGHEIFGFDHSEGMISALERLGLEVTAQSFPVVSGSHLVQWDLAKRGLGICIIMDDVGMNEPGMEIVLPELPSIQIPMWLTTHRELRTSRRIRAVFDILAEELAGPGAQPEGVGAPINLSS